MEDVSFDEAWPCMGRSSSGTRGGAAKIRIRDRNYRPATK